MTRTAELAAIVRRAAHIWRLGAARREMERRWDPWAAVRRVLDRPVPDGWCADEAVMWIGEGDCD